MGWDEKKLAPGRTFCSLWYVNSLQAICWSTIQEQQHEIDAEDLQIHNTLEESSGQLEAVAKLFMKQGEGKAAQEVELNEEDEV